MAENQYDFEQQAPELPYPASLEGAGMSSPMGGMAPPPLAIPPMPPLPQANPGLAAGYGMMSGLQGQVANPYLAQVPQMQALAVHQQQQMAQQANQMAMMQLRQMQAQQLQQRIDIERKKQQTLEQEAPLKLAGALSKVDTPVAQQISAREYARYMKNTLGIDVKPEDLMGAGTMKKEKSDHIDAMLQVAISQAPTPLTPPDFSQILSVYPGTPISYLESRAQILKDPNARGVIGVKPIQDPIAIAADKSAKLAQDWIKSHPEFGGSNGQDLFALVNQFFRQRTGRQLFTATPEEEPLVEDLRARADFLLKQEKLAARNQNYIDVAKNKLIAEARLDPSKPQPGTPQFDIELGNRTEQLIPVPEGGNVVSRGTRTPVYESPIAPQKLAELRIPGSLERPPAGTVRSDLPKMGAFAIDPEMVGNYNAVRQQFATIREIMQRRKDLFPEPTGDKVKDAANHLYARQILGRAGILGVDNDVKVLNTFKGMLPQMMSAFKGNTRTMDSNMERAIATDAFVVQPGLKSQAIQGLDTLEGMLSEGFKSMGLPDLKSNPGKGISMPPTPSGQPLFPSGGQPSPTAPQKQPQQQLPPGTKMENGKLISESGKYEWNGKSWVPR